MTALRGLLLHGERSALFTASSLDCARLCSDPALAAIRVVSNVTSDRYELVYDMGAACVQTLAAASWLCVAVLI